MCVEKIILQEEIDRVCRASILRDIKMSKFPKEKFSMLIRILENIDILPREEIEKIKEAFSLPEEKSKIIASLTDYVAKILEIIRVLGPQDN